MSERIEPFSLAVPEAVLADLRERLARTRWPDPETAAGGDQGVPLAKIQALCAHWRERYDWRRCEARLNGLGQHRARLDGLGIHFLHVRSPEADAFPLIMTHGWPGSVIEFLGVIGPLTDPVAHGGRAEDAFHLVLPSLPGYGFSDRPTAAGWGIARVADAWITLMARLGYAHWGAQGGDWGAAVARAIGARRPAACAALHLTMAFVRPTPAEVAAASTEEREALARDKRYRDVLSGYAKQQRTRPQTLGYGLADSPAGQAAWIYEKFLEWTDRTGASEEGIGLDAILDNIMLYWLPNTGASSARLYWESLGRLALDEPVTVPTGFSQFPGELALLSRRWTERRFPNIIHWNTPARGGHFPAFEQPGLFVDEVRACFRHVR